MQDTGRQVFDVYPRLLLELRQHIQQQGATHQRQIKGVAHGYGLREGRYHAGCHAGSAASNLAALHQRDFHPGSRQVVRYGAPNDSPAYDYDATIRCHCVIAYPPPTGLTTSTWSPSFRIIWGNFSRSRTSPL